MSIGTPKDTSKSDALWAWGFVVALLALAGWMAWESYPAFASRFWPSTDGVVQSLKTYANYDVKRGQLVSYNLDIAYEYTVNQKQYTGWRFNSRSNNVPEAVFNALVREYRPGAPCTVFYSPLVPSQSVLDRQVTWHSWVKLALGVAALVGGGWFSVAMWRESRAPAGPKKLSKDDADDY